VVWRAGRSAASDVARAPDYEAFVARRSAASSALLEQQLGIAAMVVGGVVVVGGILHYVHASRVAQHEPAVGVAISSGAVLLTSSGTF
jgi:hypothetical protein